MMTLLPIPFEYMQVLFKAKAFYQHFTKKKNVPCFLGKHPLPGSSGKGGSHWRTRKKTDRRSRSPWRCSLK